MDLFVKGGTVVTMDAEFRVIEDGAVAIQADSIVAVGKRTELESKFGKSKTIDGYDQRPRARRDESLPRARRRSLTR
jgi:5-methylthioadenosine/S-adenosylhomocysteine deaminase